LLSSTWRADKVAEVAEFAATATSPSPCSCHSGMIEGNDRGEWSRGTTGCARDRPSAAPMASPSPPPASSSCNPPPLLLLSLLFHSSSSCCGKLRECSGSKLSCSLLSCSRSFSSAAPLVEPRQLCRTLTYNCIYIMCVCVCVCVTFLTAVPLVER